MRIIHDVVIEPLLTFLIEPSLKSHSAIRRLAVDNWMTTGFKDIHIDLCFLVPTSIVDMPSSRVSRTSNKTKTLRDATQDFSSNSGTMLLLKFLCVVHAGN